MSEEIKVEMQEIAQLLNYLFAQQKAEALSLNILSMRDEQELTLSSSCKITKSGKQYILIGSHVRLWMARAAEASQRKN